MYILLLWASTVGPVFIVIAGLYALRRRLTKSAHKAPRPYLVPAVDAPASTSSEVADRGSAAADAANQLPSDGPSRSRRHGGTPRSTDNMAITSPTSSAAMLSSSGGPSSSIANATGIPRGYQLHGAATHQHYEFPDSVPVTSLPGVGKGSEWQNGLTEHPHQPISHREDLQAALPAPPYPSSTPHTSIDKAPPPSNTVSPPATTTAPAAAAAAAACSDAAAAAVDSTGATLCQVRSVRYFEGEIAPAVEIMPAATAATTAVGLQPDPAQADAVVDAHRVSAEGKLSQAGQGVRPDDPLMCSDSGSLSDSDDDFLARQWAAKVDRYKLCGLPNQQIKGLYPIITEQHETQNSHMVSKILPLKCQYLRLIDDLVPEAAASATAAAQSISFKALNDVVPRLRTIAVYGSVDSIVSYLVRHCCMAPALAAQLLEANGQSELQPGLTVWVPKLAIGSASTGIVGSSLWRSSGVGSALTHNTRSNSNTGHHENPSVLAPEMYVLLVGSRSAFRSPSSSQNINSYLRYAFELCSDILLLVSAEEAAGFSPSLYPFSTQNRGKLTSYALEKQTQQELQVVVQGGGFHGCYALGRNVTANLRPVIRDCCCSSSTAGIVCSWHESGRVVRQDRTLEVATNEFPARLHQLQEHYVISISQKLKSQLLLVHSSPSNKAFQLLDQNPLVLLALAVNPSFAVQLEQLKGDVQTFAATYRARVESLEQSIQQLHIRERESLRTALQALASCWSPGIAAHYGRPGSQCASSTSAAALEAAVADASATNQRLQQQNEAHLSCPICLHLYDHSGRQPIALPCHSGTHVLCVSCRDHMVSNNSRAREIRCPLCRQPHHPETFAQAPGCLPVRDWIEAAQDSQQSIHQLQSQLAERLRQQATAEEQALRQLSVCQGDLKASYKQLPTITGDRGAFFTSTRAMEMANNLVKLRFLADVVVESGPQARGLLPPGLQRLPYADTVFPSQALAYTADKLLTHAASAMKLSAASRWKFWNQKDDAAQQKQQWQMAATMRFANFKEHNPTALRRMLDSALVTAVQDMVEDLLRQLQQQQSVEVTRRVSQRRQEFVRQELSSPEYFKQQLQKFLALAEQEITASRPSASQLAVNKPTLAVTGYSEIQSKWIWDPFNDTSAQRPAQSVLHYSADEYQKGRQSYLLQQLLPGPSSCGPAAAAGVPALTTCAANAAPPVDLLDTIRLDPHEQLLLAQPVESRPGMFMYAVTCAATGSTDAAECRVHLSHRNVSNCLGSAPLLVVKKHITSASFDQTTRLLLLVCGEDQAARLFLFDEQYHAAPRQLMDIKVGDLVPTYEQVLLVPGKKELLICDDGSGYLYDVVSNRFRSARLSLPPSSQPHRVLPAPGGSVLAVLAWQDSSTTRDSCSSTAASNAESAAAASTMPSAATSHGSSEHWVMYAYCLEQEANKLLLAPIQDPIDLSELMPVSESAAFRLCSLGEQTHLVAFDLDTTGSSNPHSNMASCQMHCSSLLLHVTNFSQSNILRARGRNGTVSVSGIRASGSVANAMLDYLYSSFNKFPARSALGYAPGPTNLWVLVAPPDSTAIGNHCPTQAGSSSDSPSSVTGITSITSGMAGYIQKLWEDVQTTTSKPFQGLQFSWQVLQGWQAATDFLQPASPESVHPGLGSWIESAMMLVPLQLCRCEGNQLWPMDDGLPLILDERHTDVNKVASEISFGVYDVIFAQAAAAAEEQLPVVVVSSMGAQSVGKSYQVNHLAGCFFDVAGGRCTDGCWLSVRKHKLTDGRRCLLVLLDFEGIGSWERTEQEDMLLSLLSAAVSNVTLFKTHFTFERYTRQTLQRFNLGAPKVRAMCGGANSGVFTGDIVFCLKDVVGSAVDEVKEAFQHELTKVVQANDNFIAALYKGGAHLMDFPYPEDSRFYRELSRLASNVIMNPEEVQTVASSVQLGNLLRRLMAKISHKDWTPIHRDTIKSVVEALLLRLRQACAGGCLTDLVAGQAAPAQAELQPLLVLDTGLHIAENALLEFDIMLSSTTAASVLSEQQLAAVSAVITADAQLEGQQPADSVNSRVSSSSSAAPDHATDLDVDSSSDSGQSDESSRAFGSQRVCISHLVSPHVMVSSIPPSRQSSSSSSSSNNSSSTAMALDTAVSSEDSSSEPHGQPDQLELSLHAQVDMPDTGLLLQALTPDGQFSGPDGQRAVIQHLLDRFLELFPCFGAGQPDEHLAGQNLQAFLSAMVMCRKARAEKWASDNMRYFLEDHEAKKMLQTISKSLEQIRLNLELCGNKCGSCFMPCLLPRAHSSSTAHDCLGGHNCLHDCGYCATLHPGNPVHPAVKCQNPAGHPGPHSCGYSAHQCGMICSLADSTSNCNRQCVLAPGHEDDHRCGVEVHLCGHSCSLAGCNHSCSPPCDHDPSDRHECNNRGCPEECRLCGVHCSSDDHFHSEQDGAVHLCGMAHMCSHQCAAEGMCEIRSELRRERRRFTGRRAEFEYEHVTEQTCRRHACVKQIPAGQLGHEGACVHSEDAAVLHYCGHPCLACVYRCTKPHGHEGRHETQHGNMRHTHFVSHDNEPDEIDVGERKYVRGEQGVAETCDNYCSVMGRGHVHVLPCDPIKCDVGGLPSIYERRRHARCQYSSGQGDTDAQATDELTHDGYWAEIDFVDPCTEEQRAEFRLCGAVCGSHAHDQDELEGNPLPCCVLPLWHAPIGGTADQALLAAGVEVHTVSAAGHAYTCQHGTTYNRFHTVLVLDRSGSMDSQYIKPASPEVLTAIQQERLHLNNVSGVVCEAALAYMRIRQAKNPNDLISCVTFNHSAMPVFSSQALAAPETCSGLLRHIMPHAQPCGGTDFWAGLQAAFTVLDHSQGVAAGSTRQPDPRPIIILLTDSGDFYAARSLHSLQQMMQHWRQTLPADKVPQVHVIGYGGSVNTRFLERLVEAGDGSCVVCGGREANVAADVARLQLVGAFEQLADRPDKRGALMVTAPDVAAA